MRRNAAPELAPAPDNTALLSAIQNLHADLGSQIGGLRTGIEALAERTATVEQKVEVRRAFRSDMTVERWRKHWTPLTCRRFLAGVLNVPGPDGTAAALDTSARAGPRAKSWPNTDRYF